MIAYKHCPECQVSLMEFDREVEDGYVHVCNGCNNEEIYDSKYPRREKILEGPSTPGEGRTTEHGKIT